mgnify:CR=1 FL=1
MLIEKEFAWALWSQDLGCLSFIFIIIFNFHLFSLVDVWYMFQLFGKYDRSLVHLSMCFNTSWYECWCVNSCLLLGINKPCKQIYCIIRPGIAWSREYAIGWHNILLKFLFLDTKYVSPMYSSVLNIYKIDECLSYMISASHLLYILLLFLFGLVFQQMLLRICFSFFSFFSSNNIYYSWNLILLLFCLSLFRALSSVWLNW